MLDSPLGFCFTYNMQRWTARFLLLFALLGSFTPLALQALSMPAHACCLRKGASSCHHHINSQQSEIRSNACCSHDCCRAVNPTQSVAPVRAAVAFEQVAAGRVVGFVAAASIANSPASQKSRAPPSIA